MLSKGAEHPKSARIFAGSEESDTCGQSRPRVAVRFLPYPV